MLKLLYLLLFFVPVFGEIETRQSQGRKGKFFVHSLHSAGFFGKTGEEDLRIIRLVPVKWSATLKGRPSLPQWLHLVTSQRHSAMAYLIGTPVTPLRQMTIHVIAKSLESDQIKQQFIVINLSEDGKMALYFELLEFGPIKYNSVTTQILDLHIQNYDAETLISGMEDAARSKFVADRSGLIGKLEAAAAETFVGNNVAPYIFNIQPAPTPTGPKHQPNVFERRRIGSIVQIGSQRGFYSNLHAMVRMLRTKQSFCSNNQNVAIDKKFQKSFDIDWCQAQLHNLTIRKELTSSELRQSFYSTTKSETETAEGTESTEIIPPVSEYSFWDSILALPLFGVAIIILLLILVAVFFGCREGQQWRDYKTPKAQLEEYVSVRESQRHLRELSAQRQLLLAEKEFENSQAPSGIHAFLQPKSRTNSIRTPNSGLPIPPYSKPVPRKDSTELLANSVEMIPVGKQTVAEAAKQCGSSLHLYRNPLDSASDIEGEDNDSLEEHRVNNF